MDHIKGHCTVVHTNKRSSKMISIEINFVNVIE